MPAGGEPFEGEDRRYSPTRLNGLLEFVYAPERTRPEALSRAQMSALSVRELLVYNDRRTVWHANLGPIKTPGLLDLHADLSEIVEANRHDGDKAKPAVLVDAYPGLGKSTAVLDYAGQYYRNQIALRGAVTANGHRRVPLIYIALTGNTHIRGLNAAICRFYGLPDGGDADTLAERAKDAALSLATTVFVIDDIHFLAPYATDANAVRMANHLKFLSNTFPVTLVYVGVGVRQRGLLVEGRSPEHALAAQFGRRTTALTLHRFEIEDEAARQQWRRLLLSIERLLVLTDLYPGIIADDLSDYLYARSTGHFASLMVLINRGCLRAIRTGAERLDVALMQSVKNDAAAEADRLEMLARIDAGLLSSKPRPQRRRTAPA
jgi:hypothetical protein